VIVANVEGVFYAVLAKCPHLGLPMKTGLFRVEWRGREDGRVCLLACYVFINGLKRTGPSSHPSLLLSPFPPPRFKGNIAVEGGEPTITCKFHNSKFELSTGKCTAWSESVFGIKGTEGIAGFVGGFGGAKDSPATVFPVSTSEEGLVSIVV